ncbi:MAG: GNAT family N-acetyltransferase [Dehalococcoidales bacterium]|nr:GNAT family N-acetyltransferase [Dehalococcoidales bacterium]
MNGVMKLNKSHVRHAAAMLTRAFWDHPPLRDYYPDETERGKAAPYFFSLSVYYGLKYGEVYSPSEALEGIAVWIPSNNYPMTVWKMMRSIPLMEIYGFGRNVGSRMKSLGEYIDTVHSRITPYKHWYLQTLGVDPQHQGKGHAGQLLRHMFRRTDKEGLPCYLETLEEHNVRLYEHLGFKVVDRSLIPGTDITNWAMLRTV